MPYLIQQWQAIASNYRGTLILGNGASIAVSRSFSYQSLLEHARTNELIAPDVEQLFAFFGTEDFELILRIVWQASNVNRLLQIPDERTHAAYLRVRDCLIESVRAIHPEFDQVSGHLPSIYQFLKHFDTVASLNYDLIVYWAMMHGRDSDYIHEIKDCFGAGGFFQDNWFRLRTPIRGRLSTTLVFYPHGSLILCRDMVEQEHKIHSDGGALLEAILDLWRTETRVPLFVSEGTLEQKVSSIQNSYYLSIVYREVLASRRDSLVIYGWGLGEQDLHILRRMKLSGIRRIAVSVRRGDQDYCRRVYAIIQDVLGPVCVEFFDRESPGCWNNQNLLHTNVDTDNP
ncbi:DUF4917 domain-containing protein [Xanthomonas citri pv. fuscans]|uniref:DUF4917 family protein n=1 Tax=Xanthomonas citri TaxID=346 RepID=UPI000595EAAB|nr:DUF4917 family protein [Xanthomonas citri]KII96721.1 hypothetical protein ST33_19600 [Xanthomonas citri pv. fuscans]QWN05884.1 DUF4917 domain-containing protein [Xanthomonas citri pv. fuscans]